MMDSADGFGYKIFTDATADFSADMLRRYPLVEIIPMEVTVGGENFQYGGKGGNLTVKRFYAMQREGKFASTSQINPVTYYDYFEPVLKEGFDILYLCFSSTLSNCFNNARMCMDALWQKYPERKMFCVDTLTASVGESLLVGEAAKKQLEGWCIEELAAWSDQTKLKVCNWFMVDNFDHLKYGGRVSSITAMAGGLLNIKPLLHMNAKGELVVVQKCRGRRKAVSEKIKQMKEGWLPEISPSVIVGHGDDEEAAMMLKDAVIENFPKAEVNVAQIGPVIGAHTGPGMLALIYFGGNR
jgi:DegV family protein with EDD domain